VVELEDDRIALAAIRAWVGSNVLVDEGPGYGLTASLRLKCLIAMKLAASSEVLSVTVSAPPLTTLRMAIEVGKREFLTASPAPPPT
jgi:hypothetical protein